MTNSSAEYLGNQRADGKSFERERLRLGSLTNLQKVLTCRREGGMLPRLEAILVDTEGFDLGIEGLAGDAELRRRS